MQKGGLTFTIENGNYIEVHDDLESACHAARESSMDGTQYNVCSYRKYEYDDGKTFFTRKLIAVYIRGDIFTV